MQNDSRLGMENIENDTESGSDDENKEDNI